MSNVNSVNFNYPYLKIIIMINYLNYKVGTRTAFSLITWRVGPTTPFISPPKAKQSSASLSLPLTFYTQPPQNPQNYIQPHHLLPPNNKEMGESNNRSCCCNLCSKLIHLIISLGFAALLFWLIYRPTKIKVHVSSAHISDFNLTSNSTLSYNLTQTLTIRNPNRHLSFYYDSIHAAAGFAGTDLGSAVSELPVFFQHHKNTTTVPMAFAGTATVDAAAATEFGREKGEEAFWVEVRVRSKVRVKIMFLKFGHFKPKFYCNLKIPLSTAKNGSAFEETACDVDF